MVQCGGETSRRFLAPGVAWAYHREESSLGYKGGLESEYSLLDDEFERPFDNIESAQEYLALLSRELDAAKQDTQADIAREADSQMPRRREALRVVLYTLEKLEQHIKVSRRLLNDLRTLRRLLMDERADPVIAKDSKL